MRGGERARIELPDGSIFNVGSEARLRILKHDARNQQATLELLFTHVVRGKPPTLPAPASLERLREGDAATSIWNSP